MFVSFATVVAGALITNFATASTTFHSYIQYHISDQVTAAPAQGDHQILAHRGSGRFDPAAESPSRTAAV